ncbi:hypothetical protein SAMN04488569_10635 [Marinilactibacillus piezotolerans]|uniref:Uncharacterized protein n=1 Tax=Marinilactibacillus piezotolerans TaxID=258723 RepID=A0A1I4B5Z9_9LACT|nr:MULTISPECIES: hypothetical protein [Marinilactibacillus]SFK64205.1 hypothetical protein SAMN04488569_10635 [Marinilactibacillus piezotolerans]
MSLLLAITLVGCLTIVPLIGLTFFHVNDINESNKVKVPVRYDDNGPRRYSK